MKILFVLTPAFNPTEGGVQRIVEKLGIYFAKQGHQVLYFSFENSGHIDPKFGQLYFPTQEGGAVNRASLNYLKEVLTGEQPDVVLNEMPYETELRHFLRKQQETMKYIFLGCLNNSLFSVKNNLDLYAKRTMPASAVKWFKNPLGRYLLLQYHRFKHTHQLREIIQQHDRFVLPTDSKANRVELAYFIKDYDQSKVVGIANSIPKVEEQPKIMKEKILLYVGRLNNEQKRSDLLLPIWKRLYSSIPDWKFIIVGDGPYREAMEREIDQTGISGVYLEGYQNPQPYYEKAAIFVMPSAYEGFPSVLLEAQSNGVVPVAFDSYPAVAEIVNHTKDAMLVPAFEVNLMSETIKSLITKECLLAEMSVASRKNAAMYSTDIVGEKWLELFNNTSRTI